MADSQPHHWSEPLIEQLLRAGIAPRHVKRFVEELCAHHEDLFQQALASGKSDDEARRLATERLGPPTALAESMLSRPELYSMLGRYPRLLGSVGPTLSWIACMALGVAAIQATESLALFSTHESTWLLVAAFRTIVFALWGLPILLGAGAIIASTRQRVCMRWPLLGVSILALLGGTAQVHLFAEQGQLGLNSALLPFLFSTTGVLGPPDVTALLHGILRGSVIVACASAPLTYHLLSKSKQSRIT